MSSLAPAPDLEGLKTQVSELGIAAQVQFCGPLAARQAFTLGRTLVVPSRAESLPYVVLEAAGAAIPIIATNVGGIPEIFGPLRRRLIPSDSVVDLADALMESWRKPSTLKEAEARELARYAQSRFSATRMVDSVITALPGGNRIPTLRGRRLPPNLRGSVALITGRSS